MPKVYVKLEEGNIRQCFVLETSRTATTVDREMIRPFVRKGVQVTCLRRKGAQIYGWADEAER